MKDWSALIACTLFLCDNPKRFCNFSLRIVIYCFQFGVELNTWIRIHWRVKGNEQRTETFLACVLLSFHIFLSFSFFLNYRAVGKWYRNVVMLEFFLFCVLLRKHAMMKFLPHVTLDLDCCVIKLLCRRSLEMQVSAWSNPRGGKHPAPYYLYRCWERSLCSVDCMKSADLYLRCVPVSCRLSWFYFLPSQDARWIRLGPMKCPFHYRHFD